MNDEFHQSLADWHRAEAAATEAEEAAGRLPPALDDTPARTLRARAVVLRREADELLGGLRRLAGSQPSDPPKR
jgi:hypothetical protein